MTRLYLSNVCVILLRLGYSADITAPILLTQILLDTTKCSGTNSLLK